MTKVKVCGLMKRKDIDICIKAGVDVLGFVVEYPSPVPWNLTIEQGKELINWVPSHLTTCVVTGGAGRQDKVLEIADQLKPTVVQLHHRETLQEVREISRRLQSRGIKTVKALRIDKQGNCDFDIPDPVLAAWELAKTDLWAILVDSYTEDRPGGTGVPVDLPVFRKIQQSTSMPVILAGGLTPANVSAVIGATQPYAVDVLTGVEQEPGIKNPDKVLNFVRAVVNA